MRLQFAVQLQVIELKEQPSAGDALFPAPGFRLEDGVVLPTEEPGTLVGLELTPEEYVRWADKLKSARAELYMAPEFTIWPGRPAGNRESTEIPYIGNWLFRNRFGSPQRRAVDRVIAVSLLPSLFEGRKEALMNMNVSWNLARLREFHVIPPVLSGKKQIAPGLAVQLPEQRAQSFATAFTVRDGGTVIVAHCIHQTAAPETGRVREHFFYILTSRRIGREFGRKPPVAPAPLPQRYALSLSSLEWAPSADEAAPETVTAASSAAGSAASADAWTCGLLCVAQTPAMWDWSETASCVTGVQDAAEDARELSLAQLSAGVRGEARMKLSELGPAARLTARLSAAPAWREVAKKLESLRAEGEEEMLFEAGIQFGAEVEQTLTPGGEWVRLDAPWSPRLAGEPPDQTPPEPAHFVAACLRVAPLGGEEAPPGGR